MSLKDWIITLLLSAIPCVNIILLIVWAVSATGNENRRNYARASLILAIIAGVLSFALSLLMGEVLVDLMNGVFSNYPYY
jgi:ABC-type Fe3+ transport system permease subunit